ncbi:MAG: hypothetical protein WC987_09490, partial [Mariniphaga sp.]
KQPFSGIRQDKKSEYKANQREDKGLLRATLTIALSKKYQYVKIDFYSKKVEIDGKTTFFK